MPTVSRMIASLTASGGSHRRRWMPVNGCSVAAAPRKPPPSCIHWRFRRANSEPRAPLFYHCVLVRRKLAKREMQRACVASTRARGLAKTRGNPPCAHIAVRSSLRAGGQAPAPCAECAALRDRELQQRQRHRPRARQNQLQVHRRMVVRALMSRSSPLYQRLQSSRSSSGQR